jgi:hypothetical protein
VEVGVDEPGHDGSTLEIENSRAWTPQIVQAVVAASQDVPAGNGQMAGARLGRVERIDRGIPQEHVRLHRAPIVSAIIVQRAEY